MARPIEMKTAELIKIIKMRKEGATLEQLEKELPYSRSSLARIINHYLPHLKDDFEKRNNRIIEMSLEGKTCAEIAQEIGVSSSRVSQITKHLRLETPTPPLRNSASLEHIKEDYERRLAQIVEESKTKFIENELRDMIENKKLSYTAIAKIMGKASSVIMNMCRKYDLRSTHLSNNPYFKNKAQE